jgi:type IX secretion system PorP/SprF family membrane protein
MLLRLLTFLFAIQLATVALAQQGLQFSQFMYNPMAVNPAAAGTAEAFRAVGLHRSQWVGLSGAPVYQTISADLPIYSVGSGAGLMLVNDRLGVENNFAVYGSYAYQIKVGSGMLSAGVQAGWMQKVLDGTLLTTPGGIYEQGVIDHNDNVIPGQKVTASSPDFGLGLIYLFENWMVGLSATHLLAPSFKYNAGVESAISYNRHLNLIASWSSEIARDWELFPSLHVKSDLVKLQAEAAVIATYNDFASLGVAFRGYSGESRDAVVGILGLRASSNLFVGYSFDYGLSALQNVHNGSHEIHLRFLKPMVPPRKGKIINNPRFLSF